MTAFFVWIYFIALAVVSMIQSNFSVGLSYIYTEVYILCKVKRIVMMSVLPVRGWVSISLFVGCSCFVSCAYRLYVLYMVIGLLCD